MSAAGYDVTVNRDIPIPERSTYIPHWTPNHPDLDVDVSQDGEPLGFKLRQVLPERRWAVKTNGELIDPRDYRDQYVKWIARECVGSGQIVSIASHNRHFNPELVGIPPLREFVDCKIDGSGKRVPINYNPDHVSAPKPKPMFTHEGELAKPKGDSEKPAGFVAKAVEEGEAPEDAGSVFVAACGKACKSQAGRKAHERGHGCNAPTGEAA